MIGVPTKTPQLLSSRLWPVNTDRLIGDIIDSIYEAAAEPQLWTNALCQIANVTRANAISLPLFESLSSPSLGLIATLNLGDDFRTEHSKYAHLNPYFVRGAHWFAECKALSGEMIIPEREFSQSEYYNDFLRRFDLFYHCGGAVLREDSAVAILRVNRPRRGPPFGERELGILRLLMPHLKRALQFQRRLSLVETRGQALLAGLDALPTGFVLVDARGKILLINRSAEVILRQNDGLSTNCQMLRAACRSESERLREIVCTAARTGASNGTQAGGAISISRPSLRRPYSVLVCTLRLSHNPYPTAKFPAAVVFITDPDSSRQADEKILRALFGLTVAECHLAAVLQNGATLQKAAELLGISRNTAHSQLAAIFDKTRTNRQTELIRVIGGALGSVEPKRAA
jgi:DNA-binding CsgD family transcriptional regulator